MVGVGGGGKFGGYKEGWKVPEQDKLSSSPKMGIQEAAKEGRRPQRMFHHFCVWASLIQLVSGKQMWWVKDVHVGGPDK